MLAARLLLERVLNLRRAWLGEEHPDTLISATKLAADLHELGHDDRARKLEECIQSHR